MFMVGSDLGVLDELGRRAHSSERQEGSDHKDRELSPT